MSVNEYRFRFRIAISHRSSRVKCENFFMHGFSHIIPRCRSNSKGNPGVAPDGLN
jgi:hypothetical protein